jgi:hypothetical protein
VGVFLRLFGRIEAPDSEAIDDAYALFEGALDLAGGDASRAWRTTVYALLQSPETVYY